MRSSWLRTTTSAVPMIGPCLKASCSLKTSVGSAYRLSTAVPGLHRSGHAQRRHAVVVGLAADSPATTQQAPDVAIPPPDLTHLHTSAAVESRATGAEPDPRVHEEAQRQAAGTRFHSSSSSEPNSVTESSGASDSEDEAPTAAAEATTAAVPSSVASPPAPQARDPSTTARSQDELPPGPARTTSSQAAGGRTSPQDGQQGSSQTASLRKNEWQVKRVDISDATQFPGIIPSPPVALPPHQHQHAPLPGSAYVDSQQLSQLGCADPWMDRQLAAIQLDLEQDFQLKAAVRLHNLVFTDSMALSNHIWRILHRHAIGHRIPHPYHAQLLDLLNKGHRDPGSKIGSGVDYFFAGESSLYRSKCFMIKRVDGSVEEFSYRKCVGNLFTSSWQPMEGPSIMAILRACATVFLAHEYILRKPDMAQSAHHKLFNLCRSLRIDLPATPADAATAALSHWAEQRALHEQGYPSSFNACLAARTLQTLARLCKADPDCRQLVADTAVVQQALEALQAEEDSLGAHHAACVLWELHGLRYLPPQWLLERLQRNAVQRSGSVRLQPADCVRVVEALLGLQVRAGGLVAALLAEVDVELQAGGRLGMQLLVSLLRTCARLGQVAPAAVPSGMPQQVLTVIDQQPIENLKGSQVTLLLWALLRLRLQPGQRLLRAAAEVSFKVQHAALVPLLWALLAQLRYVPAPGELVTLDAWMATHVNELHPRGLQRLVWALGRFASVGLVPAGAARLAVVFCLQRAVAAAVAMQPPCPLPTVTACLWAVVQQGALEDVNVEALWARVNERPKDTYDALKQLPRPLVARTVLLQLLEVGDALQEAGAGLPPLHARLRRTAEAAFESDGDEAEDGQATAGGQGLLTGQEALRRAAAALQNSQGNTVHGDGLA